MKETVAEKQKQDKNKQKKLSNLVVAYVNKRSKQPSFYIFIRMCGSISHSLDMECHLSVMST